jgi:magnesium chelatase family protein
VVTISRAQGSLTFPANFQLVAAMNPCPCGYYGDPLKACACSAGTVTKYQKRISGPLLDRIDIHIEVPRVEYEKLSDSRLGEPSSAIQERVERAREIQRRRFAEMDHPNHEKARQDHGSGSLLPIACNADMGPAEVRLFCGLDDTCQALMLSATSQLHLSARAYHRTLKLARSIGPAHLAEALQYRPKSLTTG